MPYARHATNTATPAVAAPPARYLGASLFGYIYAPYTLATLPKNDPHATISALFSNGRGKLEATNFTMIWKQDDAPIGSKNIAKKRAAVFIVETMMTFPMQAISIRTFPAVNVTMRLTMKAANHTGAVIRSVSMLLYPSVLTMAGKKNTNDCTRFPQCWRRRKMLHAFIFKQEDETHPCRDTAGSVFLACVVDESLLSVATFLVAEPACVVGVVWK